jgi:cell division protein FtsB
MQGTLQEENVQAGPRAAPAAEKPRLLRERAYEWSQQMWRPAGTMLAVGLAGLLMWHVVNGKDGLSIWQQKRAEDRQLQKEIKDLEQENTQLSQRIDRLQSDPDAIEHEAREKLHYAKPGEVIYALPAPAAADQTQPGGSPNR